MNDFDLPSEPSNFIETEIFDFENIFFALKEKIDSLPCAARLTDHEIELIYSLAYSFFQQGKIEKAHSIFQVLVFYRPTDVRFLEALAISSKKIGDFENASLNFMLLFLNSPNDLKFAQHVAECLSADGNEELALEVLDNISKSQSIDLKENELVSVRCELLKTMLQNNTHAGNNKLN